MSTFQTFPHYPRNSLHPIDRCDYPAYVAFPMGCADGSEHNRGHHHRYDYGTEISEILESCPLGKLRRKYEFTWHVFETWCSWQ